MRLCWGRSRHSKRSPGRPPSTKKFGEIPVGKKLDYIEKFLKEHPDTTGIKIPARLAEAGDGILISDTQDRIR